MTKKNLCADMRSLRRSEMLSGDGGLDRPYLSRQYDGPKEVELDGDRLIWRLIGTWDVGIVRGGDRSKGALMRFIQLADEPPEGILDFARGHGVLGICPHNLPASHNPPTAPLTRKITWCTPLRLKGSYCWEPIETWRHFSRQARALIRIAARLHQGRLGSPGDWDTVYEWEPIGERMIHDGDIWVDRMMVALLVNQWLGMGGVRAFFQWREEGTRISFDSHLFGVLATQLMLAINRGGGFGLCSGCGEWYVPEKRGPKANQRNYCKKCGRRASNRDAQAARRRRQLESQMVDQLSDGVGEGG